jgi:hypothetical protein
MDEIYLHVSDLDYFFVAFRLVHGLMLMFICELVGWNKEKTQREIGTGQNRGTGESKGWVVWAATHFKIQPRRLHSLSFSSHHLYL